MSKRIPLVKNMEDILVANGWSFLDPDENDQYLLNFNRNLLNLDEKDPLRLKEYKKIRYSNYSNR